MSKSKRMSSKHICRCRNCGEKTHHSRWESDIGECCPICGSAKGYALSTHYHESEVLRTDKQIQEARLRWEQAWKSHAPAHS